MPNCDAINCSNSTAKGFLMKRFPTDLNRRLQWLENMKRDKWTPTKHSRICEVHFAPEMWERARQDGLKKLRPDAVPTLFSFDIQPRVRRKKKLLIQKESIIQQPRVMVSTMSIPSCNSNNEVGSEILPPFSKPIIIASTTHTSSTVEGSTSINNQMQTVKYFHTKLQNYNKIYAKTMASLRHYKKELRNSKRKCTHLERKIEENIVGEDLNIISEVFDSDQITALKKMKNYKTTKFMKWSDKTIMKALKLKFAAGNSGYDEILKQNLPYPSVRTLQRRVQNLKFDSGILDEVFQFLKPKVDCLNIHEKDCVLVFGEMAITPEVIYDTSLSKNIGNVTLADHDGIATHVLVFVLADVNRRWKQIVAYYFISNTVNSEILKEIIFKIFDKCHEINLSVSSITSNMGSSNEALWQELGITTERNRTQGCLENMFSILRSKQILPNALEVKNNLKLLCLSQYLRTPKSMLCRRQ